MNRLTLVSLSLLLIGAGCSPSTVATPRGPAPDGFVDQRNSPSPSALSQTDLQPQDLTSDYQPESGAAPSPESDPMAEGPWSGRFMTATSTDGLTWEKTGNILGDQLNVPDLVYGPDGKLYLYFVGYTLGNETNKTAVAISADDGATWVWKYATWNNWGHPKDPADPSVLWMKDEGVFRAWVTVGTTGTRTTHWADSIDGINFTYGGVAFDVGEDAIVPSVLRVGDILHLYAGDHPNRLVWHGTSTDGGRTFAFVDKLELNIVSELYPNGSSAHFAGNAVPTSNGYRLYTYGRSPQVNGTIGAMFSTDGNSWVSDGVVLEVTDPTNEANFVKDAAVIQQPNGSWFMVYTTDVP